MLSVLLFLAEAWEWLTIKELEPPFSRLVRCLAFAEHGVSHPLFSGYDLLFLAEAWVCVLFMRRSTRTNVNPGLINPWLINRKVSPLVGMQTTFGGNTPLILGRVLLGSWVNIIIACFWGKPENPNGTGKRRRFFVLQSWDRKRSRKGGLAWFLSRVVVDHSGFLQPLL